VLTAVGPITLRRVYFRCDACCLGEYPLDQPLGLDGSLSKQARRLITFAGGQQSFARAEQILQELCGWSISDESIRQACYTEADRIAAWQGEDERAYQGFLQAAGEIELQIDAAKVNTTDGWRDMKMAVYGKRQRGEPATPEQWDKRRLPKPSARVAFARIEEAEGFGRRLADWTERLQVNTRQASVLGDGAEWIWNLADEHVPGAKHCLDIYHGCEYLSDAAKAMFGQGSEPAERWLEQARQRLLGDGWWGLCEQVAQTLHDQGETAREPLEAMLDYFSKNTQRLGYCARLYAGQAIGSGMVEGAAKNMIGKRLKQTAARWKLDNVQKMAVLCCCTYSDTWALYWTAA
jgi:hypothetical protein